MPGSRNRQTEKNEAADLTKIAGSPISSRTRSSKATSSTAHPVSKPRHTQATTPKSASVRSSAATKSAWKGLSSGQRFAKSSGRSSATASVLYNTSDRSETDKSSTKPDSWTHSEGPDMAYFKSRPDRVVQNRRLQDNDEPMPLGRAPAKSDAETCVVCMSPPDNPKRLDKCGHVFCKACIDQCFSKINPLCPICGTAYGTRTGNMPKGTMHSRVDRYSQLPGHGGCGTIVIEYNFPSGIQTSEHAHPGRQYYGTHRIAYLPDNAEGNKVLRLLKKAFDRRMTFTVGRSATTGLDDQVVWNDVHHKTQVNGGPTAFGYPDPTYLNRVQEELATKGIVDQ